MNTTTCHQPKAAPCCAWRCRLRSIALSVLAVSGVVLACLAWIALN